jgi:hypothetical protein
MEVGAIGRRLTAKVIILVVLVSGGVGALLASIFPPGVPPTVSITKSAVYIAEQSPSSPPPLELSASTQKAVSVARAPLAPDIAARINEPKSAEAPVSKDTAEIPEQKSATPREASQERAPAKRKQYATSKAAPTKLPPPQVPSIATRLSEQWWR